MFLAWCVVSVFLSGYDKWGYLALQSVVYGVLWYYLVSHCNADIIMDAICVACILNIFMMVLQYFGKDPIFKLLHPGNFPGVMGNINHASALTALSLPAFLRKRWLIFTPLLMVGFWIARSTGGVMAAAVGIIVLSIINKQSWFVIRREFIFIFIGICGVVWFFHDLPSFNRWDVWISSFSDFTFFGHGLGSWKLADIIISGKHWTTAHNEYVQAIYELGVPAVLIMAGFACGAFRKSISVVRYEGSKLTPRCTPDHLAIMGVVVSMCLSFVSFPFHIAPLAMVSLVWLSILDNANSTKKPVNE